MSLQVFGSMASEVAAGGTACLIEHGFGQVTVVVAM